MSLTKLFSISYLFDPYPGVEFKYFWLLIVFFLLLIAFGQYAKGYIKGHSHKKVLKRLFPSIANRLTTMSLFGFAFIFFRAENIPYLAMRIWLISLLLLVFYYLGRVIYTYAKILPGQIHEKVEKKEEDKYLPKPKKKRKKKKRRK